ncbi:MAG: formylmethanofuran dehydrogenase subunit A [Nitrososphaerales archaeon]
MELIIKNGIVYDPLNGVKGEAMDIYVKDGKIVEKADGSKAQVIDATNMLVLPGGVDMHTHFAGPKVNLARMLRPEDHYKDPQRKRGVRRCGTGYSIPSVFTTGYWYAEMGFTLAFEAANPPLKMMHVQDELNDTPLIDKGAYPVFGNNWYVMESLSKGKIEECAAYIAWVLSAIKGYAIKVVDPGSVEEWKWGKGQIGDMDKQVENFGITPKEIVRGLAKVAKLLNLPHHLHIHTNMLGNPGNSEVTLETMKAVKDLVTNGELLIHMAHLQFHSYGGKEKDWNSFRSGSEEIMKYINKNPYVSFDMGQIAFTDTTTMTADGPFEYNLYEITKNKWMNADIEFETGSGIVPIEYKRDNFVHSIMWAVGLELALLSKDLWRVALSTDHPNGAPLTFYPRVISWLMSKKARERVLKLIPSSARSKTLLGSIDREFNFEEIAIITRASPAKLLGLKEKGHLGIGADADIAIYDINPKALDPERDYRKIRKAFRFAKYTIKDGKIVYKDNEIIEHFIAKTYWVNPHIREDLYNYINSELERNFDKYYTVKISNYKIPEGYLVKSKRIDIITKL